MTLLPNNHTMMEKFRNFLKTSLLGGLLVVLPVAILVIVFRWLYITVTTFIDPLSQLVIAKSNLQAVVAHLFVISLIIGGCFLVGVIVKTGFGRFIHHVVEENILKKFLPGYTLVKETLAQFIGEDRESPFNSVALVRVFSNDTLMTGFITDKHADGSCTVFVPTGPNPTSGNIFHVSKEQVYQVDIPIEDAMRSIISCGAGSRTLIEKIRALEKQKIDDKA